MSKARITARSFFDVAFKTIIVFVCLVIIPLFFLPGENEETDQFCLHKDHNNNNNNYDYYYYYCSHSKLALAEKEKQLSFCALFIIGQHK